MEEDGFEEWDDAFIEKLEQIEQLALTATQQQPRTNPNVQTHSHQPPPPRFNYAQGAFTATHSPPRELSQRSVTTREYDTVKRSDFKPPTTALTSGSVAAVPVVARSFKTNVKAAATASSSSSRSDTEIVKLKRELERVSRQLTQKEQECLELRKERENKEVQLQSATLRTEVKSSQAHDKSPFLGLSSYHTKGVQTEVEADSFPHPSDRETASCDSPSKKLKAIQRCSTDLYSGSFLASKLFIVCDTELQVLFGYCKTTKSKTEAISEENRSLVTSVDNDKLICSSDAAKVSRFYTAVTKMSSGMVQFETFYRALLDLCFIQNVVIKHRSLRILHVVLHHFAGCQELAARRDNCAIEAANNVSAFCGTDNNDIAYLKDHAAGSLHTSNAKPSCIEWLSLFQLMHQISNSITDEPILYEAVCIMNVILKRFGPSERERYGQFPVFQTVPKLLKKEASLRVQKEAVYLLYLLVNCPAVLASLYSVFKDSKSNSYDGNNGSTFEGLSAIFTGLEDCLICGGTVLEALQLRRNAITLVSYLISFGSCGHEVLWSSTACNKNGFLLLILHLLASEIDSEALNPSELTDIVKERTLLVRESLIFLNRIVSHSTFSGPALRALTSSRDNASLTVCITSKLSYKGKVLWQDDGVTKQMLETEIPNLARMLYKRVSAFLGDTISL